jgi:hypothetical protein
MLRRIGALLASLWAGALLCIAFIATPAPFAILAKADAGRVAGRILAQEAYLSVVLAVAMFLIVRSHARRAATAGAGSALSADVLLVLGSLFCTIAGYFALQPMLEAARAGQGAFSFGALHGASMGFFALKALLVLVLAWRLAGR